MRMLIKLALVLLMSVGMLNSAFAYTINDPIKDSVGFPNFELYGIDVNQSGDDINFDIFSNYKGAVQVGLWDTFAGDLALDVNKDGFYELGIAFSNHDGLTKGGIYNVSDWYLSNNYALSGYSYNKGKIVTIKNINGAAIGMTTVDWSSPQSSYPWYQVSTSVNAGDILPAGFKGDVGVFYSVATCANDYAMGSVHMENNPVPEPMTMLLFGPALLGLVGLKKKKS
ncbi:MAG: PEP-CTERM sorting domain-containing protein [Candidatus Omnitrophota bacterium]